MGWLQGGPFLEVSFLLPVNNNRRTVTNALLVNLKDFVPTIELALADQELKEKIDEFDNGYPYEPSNSNSTVLHSVQLPAYVNIEGRRKAILNIEQVSDQLMIVNFCFYGSELDEPELNQVGITPNQLPAFKDLLIKLFDRFDFPVGTVGYEMNCLNLFDSTNGWPNSDYQLENINKDKVMNPGKNYLTMVLTNKNYFADLENVKQHRNGQIHER